MARKKAAKRKSTRKKKEEETEESDEIFALNPETKKGLFTLLIFVFAILFTLAYFNLAGALGGHLDNLNRNVFGILNPLLPILLYFIALSRLMGKSIGIDIAVRFGSALLLITLSSMVHLVRWRETGVVFGKGLKEGGGYIGMLISFLFRVPFLLQML